MDYFYYDDHVALSNPELNWTRQLMHQLRPIHGLVADLLTTGSPRHSGFRRLIGVLLLSSYAYVFLIWLILSGFETSSAFLLCLICGTVPGFQNLVSYLVASPALLGAFFGASSVLLFGWGIYIRRHTVAVRVTIMAGTVILLFLGLSTNGLTVLCCWPLWICTLCSPRVADWRVLIRSLIGFMVLFALACVVHYGFFKMVSTMTSLIPVLTQRASFVANPTDALEKIVWFVRDILPYSFVQLLRSLVPSMLPYYKFLRVGLPLIMALGALSLFFCQKKPRPVEAILVLILTGGLIPLCYLPFLVLREKGGFPYYFAALEASFLCLFCAGCLNLGKLVLPTRYVRPVWLGAIGLLALLSAYTAHRNVMISYAVPNAIEYAFVKARLVEKDLTVIKEIHVRGSLNFSSVLSYSEGLVKAVLNELHSGRRDLNITSSSIDPPLVIFDPIYSRNKHLLGGYYVFNEYHGCYLMRNDMSQSDKDALKSRWDELFAQKLQEKNILIVDLSKITSVIDTLKRRP